MHAFEQKKVSCVWRLLGHPVYRMKGTFIRNSPYASQANVRLRVCNHSEHDTELSEPVNRDGFEALV